MRDSATWITPDIACDIAEVYGTPTHALNLHRLQNNYHRIQSEFDGKGLNMTVLYSVKTNYIPTIVDCLRKFGCGADVVSGTELELALNLGFSTENVVFNGPHKTDKEIENAICAGVTINIDSINEAFRIRSLAESLGKQPNVGLRVNPGIPVYVSEDPTFNIQAMASAQQSKFGFTIDDGAAEKAIEEIGFGVGVLTLTGLHCHLGSQITDESAYVSALDKVLGFAKKLMHTHPIETINIGGGLVWRAFDENVEGLFANL